MSPAPSKVEALQIATEPTSVADLRSFLGMCNYSSKFIPNYSQKTGILRQLLHKDTTWMWTAEHKNCFEQLKKELSQDTVMSYYNTESDTEVHVDASPFGVGAMLSQTDKNGIFHPVAYASRSLTDTEQRYAQIERESLATVFGCFKFHNFLFGKPFKIISDHQPLQTLFNNPKKQTTLRIERMRLKLQDYDFTVKYQPGSKNVVDYLSRHPVNDTSSLELEKTEHYVNLVINENIEATKKDKLLSTVIQHLEGSRIPKTQELKKFSTIQDELSIHDGIILKSERIVIPQNLQSKLLQIAHEGHLGIVKTKQFLRDRVFFFGMDKAVEELVKNCLPCQVSTPIQSQEPVIMSPLPDYPWQKLSMDFSGPYPNGEYLLALMDDYSRYPVVSIIKSTSSNTVIPELDRILSEFGIPEEIRTDNGPPFQSEKFQKYATHIGFHHRKVTPRFPRANGQIEKFMDSLNKAVRTAHTDGLNWKQELFKFLRNYRATKHSTTDQSPYELLFSRTMNTKIPQLVKITNDKQVRQKDSNNKDKMKLYADKKCYVKNHKFKLGDFVLCKQDKINKLSTPLERNIYKILNINGSMITAKREMDGKEICRNSSFFKIFNKTNGKENRKQQINLDENNNSDDDIFMDEEIPVQDFNNQGAQHNLSQQPIRPNRINPHPPPRRNPARNRRLPIRYRDN